MAKKNKLKTKKTAADYWIFALKVLLLAATMIYPIFMNVLGGIGMMLNGEEAYQSCGKVLIVSSLVIAFSVMLCLKGANISASVIDVIALIVCLAAVSKYCAGAGDMTDEFLVPLADKYQIRHYPTVIVTVLQLVLAGVQFLGYDESVRREQRRRDKYERLNGEAPQIIPDQEIEEKQLQKKPKQQ